MKQKHEKIYKWTIRRVKYPAQTTHGAWFVQNTFCAPWRLSA